MLAPILLTLELAALTTLLLIGTPVAWWLARSRVWWKEGGAENNHKTSPTVTRRYVAPIRFPS